MQEIIHRFHLERYNTNNKQRVGQLANTLGVWQQLVKRPVATCSQESPAAMFGMGSAWPTMAPTVAGNLLLARDLGPVKRSANWTTVG